MLIDDILNEAGIDFDTDGDERIMACPFCVGSTDVTGERKVFGVNTVSGWAHCLRCDWGSKNIVYTARELCAAFDIDFTWRLRLSAAQQSEEVTEKKKKPVKEPEVLGLPREFEYFTPGGSVIDDDIERQALRYLQSRGFVERDITEYRLGYAAVGFFSWRVIFPVIGDDDMVYGCVGRDFSSQQQGIPYLNTLGVRLLWNGHRSGHAFVLGEGVMDGAQINRALRSSMPNTVAGAALGTGLTEHQVAQLAKYKRVIHFPDFDRPGVRATMKRAEITHTAGIETLVVVPEGMTGDDPGAMKKDRIEHYIRNAQPWTSATRMRLRLSLLR